jgi:NADH dehydrogenase
MSLARLQAAVCEHLPSKPLTRDQLLLLAQDNVVGADAKTLADLGLSSCPVELVVPTYLARYRSGGRRPSPIMG